MAKKEDETEVEIAEVTAESSVEVDEKPVKASKGPIVVKYRDLAVSRLSAPFQRTFTARTLRSSLKSQEDERSTHHRVALSEASFG